MFSLIFNLISLLISFAFPLITTFKSLKTNNIQLIKPWLVYWLVYSTLVIIEFQFYNLLQYLPFYSILKLYLSIWLILPNTKGYEFIYINYIEFYLGNYEFEIDQFFNKLNSKNPLEFIISILKSLNIIKTNGSITSTNGTNGTSTNNLLDSFANSIISKQPQQSNILESLFGVFQSIPKGNERSVDTTSGTSISINTNGNTDDYDLGNEYEDINESLDNEKVNGVDENKEINETNETKGSNGWFNWWNNGYKPIDQKED